MVPATCIVFCCCRNLCRCYHLVLNLCTSLAILDKMYLNLYICTFPCHFGQDVSEFTWTHFGQRVSEFIWTMALGCVCILYSIVPNLWETHCLSWITPRAMWGRLVMWPASDATWIWGTFRVAVRLRRGHPTPGLIQLAVQTRAAPEGASHFTSSLHRNSSPGESGQASHDSFTNWVLLAASDSITNFLRGHVS